MDLTAVPSQENLGIGVVGTIAQQSAPGTGYWVRGQALYRMSGSRDLMEHDRWSGVAWTPWPDFLRELLNGEPGLDEVSASEARSRFPQAFRKVGE